MIESIAYSWDPIAGVQYGQATVSWPAVALDEDGYNAQVRNYELHVSLDGGVTYSLATTVSGGVLQATLPRYRTGQTLKVILFAVGTDGSFSDPSDPLDVELVVDETPPSAPAGLSGVREGRTLRVAWDGTLTDSIPEDFSHVAIERGADGFTFGAGTKVRSVRRAESFIVGTNEANTTTYFKAVAYDLAGNASDVASFSVSPDTTAPPAPTGLTVEQQMGVIAVTWDGTLSSTIPADFDGIRVHIGTTLGFTADASNLIGSMPRRGVLSIAGQETGVLKYLKAVSVDVLGNASSAVLVGSVTPEAVVDFDPADRTIEGIKLVEGAIGYDEIAAEAIYGDVIKANGIEAGKMAVGALDAFLITSPHMRSSEDAGDGEYGFELDSYGLHFVDPDGAATIDLDGTTGKAMITGDFFTDVPGASQRTGLVRSPQESEPIAAGTGATFDDPVGSPAGTYLVDKQGILFEDEYFEAAPSLTVTRHRETFPGYTPGVHHARWAEDKIRSELVLTTGTAEEAGGGKVYSQLTSSAASDLRLESIKTDPDFPDEYAKGAVGVYPSRVDVSAVTMPEGEHEPTSWAAFQAWNDISQYGWAKMEHVAPAMGSGTYSAHGESVTLAPSIAQVLSRTVLDSSEKYWAPAVVAGGTRQVSALQAFMNVRSERRGAFDDPPGVYLGIAKEWDSPSGGGANIDPDGAVLAVLPGSLTFGPNRWEVEVDPTAEVNGWGQTGSGMRARADYLSLDRDKLRSRVNGAALDLIGTHGSTPQFSVTFPTSYDPVVTEAKGVETYAQAAALKVTPTEMTFNGGVVNPPGAIMDYAGATAPAGWLLCDGSAVSRTTYAALFDVIGTTYGAGNGTTTFNLPDTRNRVSVGKGSDTEFDTLGETGGASTSSHTHSLSSSGQALLTVAQTAPSLRVNRTSAASWSATHTLDPTPRATTGTDSSSTGISLSGATDSGSSSTVQKYITFNRIIKY